MKKFIACQTVITVILVNLVLPVPDAAFGDPRAQMVQIVCGKQLYHNTSISISNFVATMEKLSPQMQTSGYGMSVTSSGPDTNYALADCYGDLSLHECVLCYAEARTILPQCYPFNGGRIFLDGCFMRAENYSFFQEYTGPNDRVLCGNRTRKNSAFRVSSRQAVEKVVSAAPENNFYARAQVPVSGTANESAYVLAGCWRTLSSDYCRACLENASASILGCLPWSEGRALNAGCFMRYSDTNFLNPTQGNGSLDPTQGNGSLVGSLDPTQGNGSLDPTQGNGSLDPTQGKGSLDPKQGNESLDPTQGNGSLNPTNGNGSLNATKGNGSSNPTQGNGSSRGKITIIIVATVSSIAVLVIGAVVGVYIWKHRTKKKKGDAEKLVKPLYDSCLNFKYSTLEKATGSFDEANKLGQGGFGTVYKGVLLGGREIAVKRLFFNNKHRAADFYNEVNIISSVEHKNLVKLLGCSFSGPESLLVYEYLPNKSLDFFIFDSSKGKTLNWEKRFEIIIGTAEGLMYLHENTKTRIVHRDIKASNILLDSRFHAKIADFGLARSFQDDKSHISTAIAGTLGYMAPEYLARGQLTEKADVYSFGVLLIEIVTGRQNNRSKASEDSDSSLTLAWKHFQRRTVEELFDPNVMLHNYHNMDVKMAILRVIHVGLLCTQEIPSLRPSMSKALEMLVKKEEHLPAPTNPPYIYDTVELNDTHQDQHSPVEYGNPASIATISQSIFYPR